MLTNISASLFFIVILQKLFTEIASFRSSEMSIVPIIQSLDQLKTMYKNGWATFVDVCDSFLFLGGNEKETTSYLSQRADKHKHIYTQSKYFQQ